MSTRSGRGIRSDGRTTRLARLLLAIGSLAVALLVVEVFLQVAGIKAPYEVYYPGEIETEPSRSADPRIGWKLVPNEPVREVTPDYSVEYHPNGQGFRSAWDFEEPFDGTRIVFLGDSYTFGSGTPYEDTFVARIESELTDSRCYNLGIGAFGIDQMWMTMRHYGAALEPHVVVLSFIRNDLERSLSKYKKNDVWYEKPAFRLKGQLLVPQTPENSPGSVARFVRHRLGVARLWSRIEYSVSRRFAVGYRWRLNRAIFEEIRKETDELGAELVVVHIPINRLHPAPALGREFRRMGIRFLDLTEHLPEEREDLYYPEDRHFTGEGHAFAAEHILRYLAEEALVKKVSDPN
jgi:hypothetical protein